MAQEILDTIEQIEEKAKKVLADARVKAAEIIRKSRDEISSIQAEELPLDDVKRECNKIAADAEAEAEKVVDEAAKRAAAIKDTVKKKIDKIIEKIANTITGI